MSLITKTQHRYDSLLVMNDQTKIKRLQNTRYKLQNICQFTLLDEKYTTFYIKSKFMYVPFVCHNNERAIYYGSRIVH